MAKTQKQIADFLGIDKQKVYRFIKKNNIEEAFQRNGTKYYDETAEKAIIKGLSEKPIQREAPQGASKSDSLEAVVSILKNELDMKNEQIRELNARLAETTAALKLAQENASAAQALHAGTMKQQLEAPVPVETDTPADPQKPKKSFWNRFKR